MSIRGIEHIGITVPDLDEATRFLVDAFDAFVLYNTLTEEDPPQQGPEAQATLGITADTSVVAFRFLHLRNGPGIELFEARRPEPIQPISLGDIGIHHFAIYCDCVEASVSRAVAAGATALSGPRRLEGPEEGSGNRMNYVRAPWGTLIELIAFPSGVADRPPVQRWVPNEQ